MVPGGVASGGVLGGLARPEVPPGAQRALVDALHALHHEAGWPSLRCAGPGGGLLAHHGLDRVLLARLPSWGVLELVVEAMGGNVGEFRRLWLAASGPASAPGPRIAGRRAELAAVRRHLESGTGLLLVTGEAGIGKTRLVDTAATSARRATPSWRGVRACRCRPRCHCSRSPTSCARCTRWITASGSRRVSPSARRTCWPRCAGCCRSSTSLSTAGGPPDDDWWRQRLFSAVGTTLVRALPRCGRSRCWSRTCTGPTRRPSTCSSTCSADFPGSRWWAPTDTTIRPLLPRRARLDGPIRRRSAVDNSRWTHSLATTPPRCSRCSPGRQTPNAVDRIHQRAAVCRCSPNSSRRSRPRMKRCPTFSPTCSMDDLEAPRMRVGHRTRTRRGGPTTDRRPAAFADRSLARRVDRGASRARRAFLITTGVHEVRLRHPLFAEAVRRRLVAGEAADEHRRLALTLAESPRPSAAEVAEHWQRADDPEQEILWRIRAAQEAGARFALAHEAEQWRRALELWPDDATYAGSPGVRKVEAYLAAIDALEGVDWQAADRLADEAMRSVADPQGPSAAEVYRRAGKIQANLGNPHAGLEPRGSRPAHSRCASTAR